MHFSEWGFFGMHLLWWLFWIVVIIMALVVFMSESVRIVRRRETPLELLQRRHMAGEIPQKEYEERKYTLERDTQFMK